MSYLASLTDWQRHSKYLVRHRRPPSQNWRTFLKNHMQSLVSADFFVVPTITSGFCLFL
jgi:hypothetical protein